MSTITKHTVLDLEPAHANWSVSVQREDYADPAEESGVLLSVGRTTVMLTLAEALKIALGLSGAVDGARAVVAVADEDDGDDGAPETCERCDGSGTHIGDNPGSPRHHECAECDGTGVAA